jgi:hypothetical protein
MTWLTPDGLDRHNWQFRGMKGQRGGWDQVLWIWLQREWHKAVTA